MSPALSPVLTAALEQVAVDPSCRTATVGTDEVTADSARDLVRSLGQRLYRNLHTGATTTPARDTNRDFALERRLAEALPKLTTTISAPVLEVRDDGTVVVERDGLRVAAAPGSVLGTVPPRPGGTVELEVSTARPALSPGFFLTTQRHGSRPSGRVLRVYLHLLDVDAVTRVWRTVLRALHEAGASHVAKVLSAPERLPRRDAMVVYLDAESAGFAARLPELLDGCRGLGEQTSTFAHRVLPGAAIAWEPADPRPGMTGLSFGQHRAIATATGLVRHAAGASGRTRAEHVVGALREANIDPSAPARNLDSPDHPGLRDTHRKRGGTDEHAGTGVRL
jgi:HopA1 effector protein family